MTFYHWTSPNFLPLILRRGLRPLQTIEHVTDKPVVWLTTEPELITYIPDGLSAEQKLQLFKYMNEHHRFPLFTPLRLSVRVSKNDSRLQTGRDFNAKLDYQPVYTPECWYVFEGPIGASKIHDPTFIMPEFVAEEGMTIHDHMCSWPSRCVDADLNVIDRCFPEYLPEYEVLPIGNYH